MKGITSTVAMLSLALLSACKSSDHQEKTATLCTTVENSKIQPGETGFRSVNLTSSANNTLIGYTDSGQIVPHSECSAAKVVQLLSGTMYSWFEFGQPIEKDGVHSILYYTNLNQTLSTKTARLEKEGRWQTQWAEGGKITKQEWTKEPQFSLVEAVNDFEGDGIKQTVITTGKITKTKRFNANSQQYDCMWNNDGVLTSDMGCSNEISNDLSIIGLMVDSDSYLQTLTSATITYETDPDELWEDINRYW
ncbi:hypothetical protein [Vibrio sp. 1180_3]|uniref:hypothetical protein n=1 Tax=Vibrio sp. 1180_3 TaxID=2528832 RepID=UPI002404EC0B|nr:hypothetical protein [Vibrio sp. 1180_3]MDF9399168.1 hypothetical protein [Vibrio sp. 1180_3]